MKYSEFLEYSVTPEGRRDLRTEILHKCEWLFHTTDRSAIASIRRTGLNPRYPGFAVPEYVQHAMPGYDGSLLCLAPSRDGIVVGGQLEVVERQITLAVHRDDFPQNALIDWSFPHLICTLRWRIEQPEIDLMSASRVAIAHCIQSGSLAFIDSIPASKIRVATQASSIAPPSWPFLVDVLDS